MDNEKDLEFNFGEEQNTENKENIAEEEFVDIVSDTSLTDENGRKAEAEEKPAKSNWWKRMKTWKKITFISVCVLLAFMLAIGGFLIWLRYFYLNYNYDDLPNDPSYFDTTGQIDEKIINIALFGVDTRDTDVLTAADARKKHKDIPRSDSIMILSINTETKTIKIISVLRDSFVPIVEDGSTRYVKINEAYTKGPEVAMRTLNRIFDLDITEYATVNFYGMAEIIDELGGIDITVAKEELVKNPPKNSPGLNQCMDEICKNLGINPQNYYINEPGLHHVNGIQAVAYSRIRHYKSIFGSNDDYGRTDRQRHVMHELFTKALSLKKMEYLSFVHKLIPYTKTSLETDKILSIAFSVMFDNPTLVYENMFVPQLNWKMSNKAMYEDGKGSVEYYDLDFAKDVIHAVIFDDKTMDEYVEENGIRKNDWYAAVRTSKKTQTADPAKQDDSATATNPAEQDDTGTTTTNPEEPDNTGTTTNPAEPVDPGTGTTDPVVPDENTGDAS